MQFCPTVCNTLSYFSQDQSAQPVFTISCSHPRTQQWLYRWSVSTHKVSCGCYCILMTPLNTPNLQQLVANKWLQQEPSAVANISRLGEGCCTIYNWSSKIRCKPCLSATELGSVWLVFYCLSSDIILEVWKLWKQEIHEIHGRWTTGLEGWWCEAFKSCPGRISM